MLEYSASERKKVNNLHGTSAAGPSNYRDASNPTGPWKNAPTPIAVPPQMRNPRFDLASPYDQMKDTLRRGQAPRPGNPNTHATLLGTGRQPRPPDPKRSQPDLPFSRITRRNNNSHSANNTLASSSHGGHLASCMSDTEIQIVDPPIKSALAHGRPPRDSEIEVISDREDVGVPLPRPSSPDELQLTGRHAFETLPGGLPSANPPKGKGKEFVVKPQAVTSAVSDIEEIEDFTSEPANERPSPSRPPQSQRAAVLTPSLRAIRPGNVAKKCGLYEPEPKPPPPTEPAHRPMHVDLRLKDALSGHPRVTANMKPNGAPKLVSSKLQLDPIATESTLFTSKWHSRTKEHPLKLPLRAWAMGLKIFFAEEGFDPPAFEYNPRNGHLDVSVPGQSRPYRFQYPTGFEEITVTNDSDRPLKGDVLVQLRTRTDCKVHDHGLSELEFQPGSNRLSGRLTFVFGADEVKGWTTTYQKLASLLTKSVSKHETVRPTAAKAIWEELQRHADMCQQQISRSSDSSRKSVASSIKASSSRPARRSPPRIYRARLGPDAEPPNSEAGPSAPLRRSSRRSAATVAHETMSESPPLADPEELVLVYPPSGPGALNIMGSDLNRLRPHEFLNDTLIEFGLKLWLAELGEQDPGLANQIHVFSSFFYKKLNNKKSLDEGYQSVKKWTSRVDIFSKKYIVVPINENLHWYLAIIYEPEHTLRPPLPQKEHTLSQRGKLRRNNAAEPDIIPDTQEELPLIHDPLPAEGPSEPDIEMASLDATRASTPSITQDEDMDDISPVEFTQSCSISNIPLERPRSASLSKPASMRSSSISVSKASGRSMPVAAHSINEVESIMLPRSPRLDSMDVDATVIDVEADEEGAELKGNLLSSKASTSTELSDPPSALSSKPPSRATGVPPSRFYGSSARRKEKLKADDEVVVPDSEAENEGDDDEKQENEVVVMLGGTLPSRPTHIVNDPPTTRIFTLDSLGTRHPQAQKVLKYWLKAEAKDKRNVEEVRIADGKLALVPSQPNFADCGIYLLHFAKTFLSRPTHYFDLIYQSRKVYTAEQRRLDWDEAVVQHYREDLIQRINRLSSEWKVSRAVKEEDAKRKRKSEELGQAGSDSSEAEVDIVEDITAPRPLSKAKPRPAKRMRG